MTSPLKFSWLTEKKLPDFKFEIECKLPKEVLQDIYYGRLAGHESPIFATNFYGSSFSIEIKHLVCDNARYCQICLNLKSSNHPIFKRCTMQLKANPSRGDAKNSIFYSASWEKGTDQTSYAFSNADLFHKNYDHDNFIILICTIELKITETKQYVSPNPKAPSEVQTPINQRMLNLLQSGLHSDVTFIIDKKEFKLHRNILASGCPYFSTMFGSSFKEATEPVIPMDDIAPDTFQTILEYIYTDQTPEIFEEAEKVLVAADKFGLVSLAQKCENQLTQTISKDNFKDLYEFSKLYRLKGLKDRVVYYVKYNFPELSQSEEWKEFKTENLQLTNEILESFHALAL